MALRFFTEADLAERERHRRAVAERDELLFTFARWLEDRADHDGPFAVPRLSSQTEARLIRLLRNQQDEPPGPSSDQPLSTA